MQAGKRALVRTGWGERFNDYGVCKVLVCL